jgi:DNA-binding transcriptional ArsR family regulator
MPGDFYNRRVPDWNRAVIYCRLSLRESSEIHGACKRNFDPHYHAILTQVLIMIRMTIKGMGGFYMVDKNSEEWCAHQLKALADVDRLLLVRALRERSQSVSDLAALLDNEIGNISHHLKVLRRHGLVTTKRKGKQIIYSLAGRYFKAHGNTHSKLELGCCSLKL